MLTRDWAYAAPPQREGPDHPEAQGMGGSQLAGSLHVTLLIAVFFRTSTTYRTQNGIPWLAQMADTNP
uniref:Uncharacterized protein n=1 Tax=Mycena chlorophos TaxID=658473 RepID=A0ABQ0L8K2_MYCCL|nr:predicted protein [Mycena chlorophos]